MDRETHRSYRVTLLEKLIVNFALPPDLVYHTFRALLTGDKSQTMAERIRGMWVGKIAKYQKLLRVKEENDGEIPDEFRTLCNLTPCGRVRLLMAQFSSPRKMAEAE
jgi:hypothetical protein